MEQPISKRPRRAPRDFLPELKKINKPTNLYTFNSNPVNQLSTSQHPSNLNIQIQTNLKQANQKVYYDADSIECNPEIQSERPDRSKIRQQGITVRNSPPRGKIQRTDQSGFDSNMKTTKLNQNEQQSVSSFDYLSHKKSISSGQIIKQNIRRSFNQSDISRLNENNRVQLNQEMDHNLYSSQKQFNKLALSLLGIKRTRYNKTPKKNSPRLMPGQFYYKNYGTSKKYIERVQYVQNKQKIYEHSFYPFPQKKIEGIKDEINRISDMSRLRRNHVRYNKEQEVKQPQDNPEQKQKIKGEKIVYSELFYKTKRELIKVSIKTSLSSLKNLLEYNLKNSSIQIQIPNFFIKPPHQFYNFENLNPEAIHNQSIHIFSVLEIPVVSINIRKYSNCFVIINHNICIVWHEGRQGKKYIGSWKNKYFDEGEKQGLGLEWSPGKYIYYGQFKENKRNGFGIMRKNDGSIVLGYWKNGKSLQFGIEKNYGQ